MRPRWWIIALSLTCLWFGGLAISLDLRADIAEKKQITTERRAGRAEAPKLVSTGRVVSRGVFVANAAWWDKFVGLPAPYSLLIVMGATTSLIWLGCYVSSFLFQRRY
jgi:hypothetical protein